MANKYMKKCSISLGIREMQIETKIRYHHTPIRTDIIKDTAITSAVDEVKKKKPLYTVDRNVNWKTSREQRFEVPQNIKNKRIYTA